MGYNPTFYLENQLTGYRAAKAITIDHTKVGATDSSNFPMYFSGTYPYLKTIANGGGVTNSSGFDIIFTSDSLGSTTLNFQIISYNGTTGAVSFWVKIPTVSHTTDTVIYLFYGNTSITTTQATPTSVWDSNYKFVMHMEDNVATKTVLDSTANGYNGTSQQNTSVIHTASGKLDSGLTFNGSTDDIQVTQSGHFGLSGSAFTVQAWVLDDSSVSTFNTAFHRVVSWYDGTKNIQLGIGSDSGGTNRLFWLFNNSITANANQASTGTQATGFHHVVGTFDGSSTYHIYVDGQNLDGATVHNSSITVFTSNSTTLYLGQRGSGTANNYLNGTLDEARISATNRSADWILAEYNNQSSPSTFYTVV